MTFECEATGATPLRYTWLHNDSGMIPPKTERKLELDVRKNLAGQYSCYVENEFGSRKSDSATLLVGEYNPI